MRCFFCGRDIYGRAAACISCFRELYREFVSILKRRLSDTDITYYNPALKRAYCLFCPNKALTKEMCGNHYHYFVYGKGYNEQG